MPIVPVFCETCGGAFSSRVFVESCLDATLDGRDYGPCPLCGRRGVASKGRLLDDIFRVTEQAVLVVSTPHWSFRALEGLAVRVADIQDGDQSPAEKIEAIKREVPELRGIADQLPHERAELHAFLSMILTAVVFVLSQCEPTRRETDMPFAKPRSRDVVDAAAELVQQHPAHLRP